MAEWQGKNGYYHLQIGKIGCLEVSIRYMPKMNEQSVFVNGEKLGYEVTWLESDEFVYGEGLAIPHPTLYPLTDEGLEQAKREAVIWGKQLLQEALDSLEQLVTDK